MTCSGSRPDNPDAAVVRSVQRGRYVVRPAQGEGDREAVEALRLRSFGQAGTRDGFDATAQQIMIEDSTSGALVCSYRLQETEAKALPASHAAQHYDLRRLMDFKGPMLELGRFCMDPVRHDPDILRAAWGGITDLVDRRGIRLLFGCSSFAGTDPAPYGAAFALLAERYLAPPRLQVARRAPAIVDLAAQGAGQPSGAGGLRKMPPLLRSYLLMGGRVSDHAVVDHAMNTLHVFTGLEISAIPESRKKLLRALV